MRTSSVPEPGGDSTINDNRDGGGWDGGGVKGGGGNGGDKGGGEGGSRGGGRGGGKGGEEGGGNNGGGAAAAGGGKKEVDGMVAESRQAVAMEATMGVEREAAAVMGVVAAKEGGRGRWQQRRRSSRRGRRNVDGMVEESREAVAMEATMGVEREAPAVVGWVAAREAPTSPPEGILEPEGEGTRRLPHVPCELAV